MKVTFNNIEGFTENQALEVLADLATQFTSDRFHDDITIEWQGEHGCYFMEFEADIYGVNEVTIELKGGIR